MNALVVKPQVNATWVAGFFGVVNGARQGPSLVPCPSLNSFANYRFSDMTAGKNYEISHYNYDNDFQSYYHGVSGTFSEEYFFPDGYTPSGFALFVQKNAQVHWQGLVDSNYHDYGYYLAKGPIIQYSGIDGSCNAPLEVLGEGTNMTQIGGSGCNVSVVNGTWLVIELASMCP